MVPLKCVQVLRRMSLFGRNNVNQSKLSVNGNEKRKRHELLTARCAGGTNRHTRPELFILEFIGKTAGERLNMEPDAQYRFRSCSRPCAFLGLLCDWCNTPIAVWLFLSLAEWMEI